MTRLRQVVLVGVAVAVLPSAVNVPHAVAANEVWVNVCGAGSASVADPPGNVGPHEIMHVKTWNDGTTLWWGTEAAADCTILREARENTRPKPSVTHLRAPLTQNELNDVCAGAQVDLDDAVLDVTSGTWGATADGGVLTIRGTGTTLAIHFGEGNIGAGSFTEGAGTFTMEGSTPCNQAGSQWMGGFVAADPEVDPTP